MMKLASLYLNFSPKNTMDYAQSLYSHGFISYPRTETSKYPENFDFHEVIADFKNNSEYFREKAEKLLDIFSNPEGNGFDSGEHPPITPLLYRRNIDKHYDNYFNDYKKTARWQNEDKLYKLIVNHFFASIAPDFIYKKIDYMLKIGQQIFSFSDNQIINEGYLEFENYDQNKYKSIYPDFEKNKRYELIDIFYEEETKPPEYMTEAELVDEMDKNKIGTDASISVHINNLSRRQYVKRDRNGHLIPTDLGIALIESFSKIDEDFILPKSREKIENYVEQVAKGKLKYEQALNQALTYYSEKFNIFYDRKRQILDNFKKYTKK